MKVGENEEKEIPCGISNEILLSNLRENEKSCESNFEIQTRIFLHKNAILRNRGIRFRPGIL
jgi:hypothetical protein